MWGALTVIVHILKPCLMQLDILVARNFPILVLGFRALQHIVEFFGINNCYVRFRRFWFRQILADNKLTFLNQVIGYLGRVLDCPEQLIRIVLQNAYPILNVGGVIFHLRSLLIIDSRRACGERRSDFRAQFLFGVAFAAKTACQITVQTVCSSGSVSRFMEKHRHIAVSIIELLHGGHTHIILRWTVIGAVAALTQLKTHIFQ